jgi:glycosyltransferase involved in cell wall biosynthesis
MAARDPAQPRVSTKSDVGLLTGGSDPPYAFGLAKALLSRGLSLDFIGSDDLDIPELRVSAKLNFLNLRGSQHGDASLSRKILRILSYYARLIRYASFAEPKVFHILWNNKFELFDRTLLMLYYKLLGKKVVLTAHNVNARRRDSKDSALNRLTLRIQYRLADHIFVHTESMKKELCADFGVREDATSVIPFGINNAVPNTELTAEQARQHLGIEADARTILFFGRIRPYKGLEFLVAAFQQLAAAHHNCLLIVAGQLSRGCEEYLDGIRRLIRDDPSRDRVIQRIKFVSDEETELYFKAADLLVLPYTQISQSGVLVLGYSFGLPVIAAEVGSFREDVIEGKTGFLVKPGDSVSLAAAIERYFRSDLFKTLPSRRREIIDYARERYSWDAVSRLTCAVYEQLAPRH